MEKDLFGVPIFGQPLPKPPENLAAVKAHFQLIGLHGKTAGQRCKNCSHFITRAFSKNYFKCTKMKTSTGPATDWRANWEACGLFTLNTENATKR